MSDATLRLMSGRPGFDLGGMYSNVMGDFVATPTVGTKSIVLSAYPSTILSSSIGLKNLVFAVFIRVPTTGIPRSIPVTSIAIAGNTITLANMDSNFELGEIVAAYIPGPIKAYDTVNDVVKNEEQLAPKYERDSELVAACQLLPSASTTFAPNFVQNLGTAAAGVVAGGITNLLSFKCHNKSGGTLYFQFFNQGTAPTGGEVPSSCFLIPAGTEVVRGEEYFRMGGKHFPNGLSWAISSTEAALTLATATDQTSEIGYKT